MARKAAGKKTSAKTAKSKSENYLDDVRELIRLMVANDLSEVDIQDNGRKIVLKRGGGADATVSPVSETSPSSAVEPVAGGGTTGAETDVSDGLIEIKSPMVGTFYASQSPDSGPFVSVGESVDEQTVVCIIEAMKVMNEIKADCIGSVVEVCMRNAQPVEFGQVLFRVKPA